jgi:hypothetical protein
MYTLRVLNKSQNVNGCHRVDWVVTLANGTTIRGYDSLGGRDTYGNKVQYQIQRVFYPENCNPEVIQAINIRFAKDPCREVGDTSTAI